MLKLRNAVLTALLAFCLAMPFVSCSFNDGATGDVSGDVKVQSDNNQNGGNENPSGGDNGGNEKPSGGDEDSGDNGNENPSGGNNGGSGNENPSGGNEKPTDPTEPGAGTTYVVIYNGDIIEESLPESMWLYGVEEVNLEEGVDYKFYDKDKKEIAYDGSDITLLKDAEYYVKLGQSTKDRFYVAYLDEELKVNSWGFMQNTDLLNIKMREIIRLLFLIFIKIHLR